MTLTSLSLPLAAVVLSPLVPAVINRTKAWFAGRRGQPLLQGYYELAKLLAKGAVYSHTTSWVFRAGPLVSLACAFTALAVLPLGGAPPPLSFTGDPILLLYLLGVMRFFTVAAAMDTGSSFEGMGASREVQFSVLTEFILLACLAVLVKVGTLALPGPVAAPSLSLLEIYADLSGAAWTAHGGAGLLLAAAALLVALLSENSRIPVDDPNTHLELTMIHEVMVLDHCGPDLGMILYGAGLKLWILCALLAGIIIPVRTHNPWLDAGASLGGIFLLAVVVGVIESSLARLRLLRVPQLLTGAGVLATVALLLVFWV
jgi:formate hydrogenlyase subunit 4